MHEGLCPLWSAEEIENMKKGSIIVDKVRLLRKFDFDRKIKYSEVKELFETGESIDVDGQAVGYDSNISYKYDLLKFMKWLEKYGIIPQELTINKTDAESIVKGLKRGKADGYNGETVTEEDLEELNTFKIETARNRFNF